MHGLVRGFGDIVVTPHHHSTAAAIEILAAGGNAVDAAIAANAVQGVVAPETCGIGGDLFALVHRPGTRLPLALNASGPAGSGVDADALLDADGAMPLFGPHSVTVPGCVAGWEALRSELGTMPLERLLAPAIRIATDGVVATEELSGALSRRASELTDTAIAAELLVDATGPALGSRVTRPSLGATLGRIADEGPAAFYEGEIAESISSAVDGLIRVEDLGAFEPEWVDPLGLRVHGMTGWTIPPNTQGYLTLASLGILERLDPSSDPAVVVHREIEAYRSMAWERDRVLSDSSFSPQPAEALVAAKLLDQRAATIDDDRANTWPEEGPVVGGTAYLAILDRDGLGVSFIQSNFHGLGTSICAGPHGFLLHNRGGSFTLEPGHPNRLAPGKRPLHTLAPTIWTDGDRLAGILGTRGGHQQPQLLTQVARRVWADGMELDDAQNAPRWTTSEFGPDVPSTILLEAEAGHEVAEGLRRRGHHVEIVAPRSGGWGPVSLITIDESGLRSGAPDPRVRVSAAAAR